MTGFLGKNASKFSKELWQLFLSAQENPNGVPPQLLEAKKEELLKQRVRSHILTPLQTVPGTNCIRNSKRERSARTIPKLARHKRRSVNKIQTVDAVVVERSKADVDEAGEMTEDQNLAETIAYLRAIAGSRAAVTIERRDQTFATWIPLVAAARAFAEMVDVAQDLVATTTDVLALHLVLTPTNRPPAALVALGAPLDVVHDHAHDHAAVPGTIVDTVRAVHAEPTIIHVAVIRPLHDDQYPPCDQFLAFQPTLVQTLAADLL